MATLMKNKINPAQTLVLGYLIVIFTGTIILSLPASHGQDYIEPLDALFTATSATAVTGLVVVETGQDWSIIGQLTIMILIQIGGLGIMATSTIIALLIGRRIGIRERMIVSEDLNQLNISGVVRLVRYILVMTFSIEFVGALILFFRFLRDMEPLKALYFSVFHSISAFCNAGFDLFGNSLEDFANDPVINFTFAILFIIGGLGFGAVIDFSTLIFNKKKTMLHTKIVLKISLFLIIVGTLTILFLEYNNADTLKDLSFGEKLMASFFQAVTPRTAGFNTIPTGNLRVSSLLFIMFLMFIGASPGSTGGGVKTTTFGALLAAVYSTITGNEDIQIYKKRISNDTVYRALTIVVLSLLVIFIAVMILATIEEFRFIQLLFESVSAFGTVKLSTGITSMLSQAGKGVIILTMFTGRLGPLTVAIAFGKRRRKTPVRYPEERIMIG